jgi:hypothetical protein
MYAAQLIEAFLSAADSWICDRYAMDTRFIARRVDTTWELVEASLAFFPLPHDRDNSFSIATAELLAGQVQAFPVTRQEAIAALEVAAKGQLEINGERFALAGPDDLDISSEMTHRDRWFCPLHLRVSARQVAAPNPANIAALDAALRRAASPFDGTADLAAWLGLNADFASAREPAITLYVAPPIDLVFDQTTLEANTLAVTLYAHPALDVHKVSLAVRAAPGDGLAGRKQVADQVVWSEPDELKRVGKVHASLPNADSALTMLSLGVETIRRQWILDPQKARNSRFISVNQFDADLRMVRQALFDTPDGRKFEQGVATLLHIIGFAAAMPLETDSPDIVVATPAGQLVVVECTTRLADFASKSGRLVERRAALSKSLAEMNLPSQVTAALVCRLRREEVSVSEKDLRDRKVLLFTAEDIESGLMRSKFMVDTDALLQQAIAAAGTTD